MRQRDREKKTTQNVRSKEETVTVKNAIPHLIRLSICLFCLRPTGCQHTSAIIQLWCDYDICWKQRQQKRKIWIKWKERGNVSKGAKAGCAEPQ